MGVMRGGIMTDTTIPESALLPLATQALKKGGLREPDAAGNHGILDMAPSVAARTQIRQHAARNEPIPPDWATDAEGRPTTDAAAAHAAKPSARRRAPAIAGTKVKPSCTRYEAP